MGWARQKSGVRAGMWGVAFFCLDFFFGSFLLYQDKSNEHKPDRALM